jgi:glutamate carboxypeptidase
MADQLINEAVAQTEVAHGVQIVMHGHIARPPKPMTPEAEALFGLVQAERAALSALTILRLAEGA